jgi:hypothetical protein
MGPLALSATRGTDSGDIRVRWAGIGGERARSRGRRTCAPNASPLPFRVVSFWRFRAGQGSRVHARLAVLAVLSIALFSANLRAGSRSVFCSLMQEVRSAPCCHRSPTPSTQVDAFDCACCHAIQAGALPETVGAPSIDVGPASLVALTAFASSGLARVESIARARHSVRPRAGPLRETDRARLMVFRI